MKVVIIAKSYIGQLEISGNKGFKDPKFQQKLAADGWKVGEAWCCYAAEMIFEEAYPEHERALDKLFSANCMLTLKNFTEAGYEISTIPVLGSLMIMQRYINGDPTTQGHAGIVTKLLNNTEWQSCEGNTNAAGGREGDGFYEKERSLMYYPTGLRVAGFVKIHEKLNPAIS